MLSAVILGLSAGLSMLLFKKLAAGFIILLITTIGIVCSFSPKIRSWEFSYDIGQYLLLVFCVGIGSMADLSQFTNSGLSYIAFTGFVMYGSLLSHFFLCWLFKIDRDTCMITSIAGILGCIYWSNCIRSRQQRDCCFWSNFFACWDCSWKLFRNYTFKLSCAIKLKKAAKRAIIIKIIKVLLLKCCWLFKVSI